jgi:hypothetical protein
MVDVMSASATQSGHLSSTVNPSQKLPRSSRGGKREGAGRPSIGVRKVQLTLDDQTIKKGTAIGDGNLSLGVRIAVASVKITLAATKRDR